MSQISEEAPTGPIRAQTHGRPGPPVPPPPARDLTRRWNVTRDLFAAALFVVALFLPWNLYFGFGIPDSKTLLWAVLGAVTLLSLASIPVTYAVKPASAGRLRLILNIPYRLLVIGFIVFDVFQTIKAGGAVTVPGGVGPGAWVGVAGSLLTSQPLITGAAADDESFKGWTRSVQILGYASMLGAALSTAFHLCWRVSYALRPAADSSGFGKQNIAVIATAVVYGVVALIAVLVASRWILRTTRASQLAVIGLGTSTLVAGILVWLLPVGRDIDAFHGIAQNTSTAGVGYEGYLAWAAAAAIFAPRALFRHRDLDAGDEDPWRGAARMGLLLITVWCLGSMLMRLTDLFVAVSLNFPYSRYDTMTLAAFDLATAVLAIWLRMNLANDGVSARLVTSLCGLVVTLSIARVVVGVELAPHFETPPNGGWTNPVYGNNLAQQITSTFDVALCGLALGILVAARIATGLTLRRQSRQRRRAVAHARRATRPTHVPAATTRIPTAPANIPTTAIPQMAGQSPRIFRGDDSATRQIKIPVQQPKIFRTPGGPA